MTVTSGRRESDLQHQREIRLYLIVPMIVAVLIVLAGGVAVLMLPRRLQVSIVADWMASFFFFCPAILCLFAVCMILIVTVVAMNKLHDQAAKPMNKLEDLSQTLVEKTAGLTDTINEKTVGYSTRFAFLDRFLNVFDPPADPVIPEKEDKNA